MIPLLPLATGNVMRESLWLERDDLTALIVRQRWVIRAKRRVSSVHPLGHELVHWDADAETCLKSLILPSRFSEETT